MSPSQLLFTSSWRNLWVVNRTTIDICWAAFCFPDSLFGYRGYPQSPFSRQAPPLLMRRRYSLTDDTPGGQGKATSAMVRTVAAGILFCSLLALVGDSSYAGSSRGAVEFARCPSCDSSFTNYCRRLLVTNPRDPHHILRKLLLSITNQRHLGFK